MTRRLWLLAGVLIVAGAGVAVWRSRPAAPSRSSVANNGVAAQAPTSPLAVRLSISPGMPGDPALAVVRVFNMRARQPAPIRVETPVAVDFATATFALETEGAGETAGPRIAATVFRLPQPTAMSLDATTTASTMLNIDAAAMPPAGARVRATVVVGGQSLVSNWADVPAPGATQADQLASRARVEDMRGDTGALARTAEALIAAAPQDPRGYFFRGIVLERSGDRAGALTAYRATLDRLRPGAEPPLGLYERIRRLQ
ncbi:MAG: hypothetical protein EPO35_01675 [Acidobacteria bacterium]|nr:MAG: hypothetical protein EPO35_01675 [Acidobacteriota bacterium]